MSVVNDLEEEIKQLKYENQLLHSIIAALPGNVYWKDNHGVYLGCNLNNAKLLGMNVPEDIIGKTTSDLVEAHLANPITQHDQITLSDGELYTEEPGFNKNREPAIYLSKKAPLYDNEGMLIGMIGVSFDITDRKKMEEDLRIAKEKAEASSRAKSQFLAIINHELRTPLASIAGLVEFLKNDKLGPSEVRKIVYSIDDCTQHLLNLVNDVLDFSSLETGKYNIREEVVDLNAILFEVHGVTNTLAQKKGLSINVQSNRDVPNHIITDGLLLRQILINLVVNGIKFTENGQVIIQLDKVGAHDNKVDLEIKVIDTGCGIPEDKLDVIFQPFQQLEDAYTRQSSRSGTGLGLAIVEKLAYLIKTKVSVISVPNQGSIFCLRGTFAVGSDKTLANTVMILPEIANSITEPKENSPVPLKCITKKQPLILLIEDDPIVQFVHKRMLFDIGCQVDAYTHGKHAIEHLKDHDMVFVDISLPDISGFEVIKRIRQLQPTKKVPIVALTVYNGKEERNASLQAGADEFASKPVTQARLQKLIAKYMQH